jgi:hypothetical protein
MEEYAHMDTISRKAKERAREATESAEASASDAAEGMRECQTVILAATQANIAAMFEYMREAFSAKSIPELMEVSTRHAQRQMQIMTQQAREIASAMQKATMESTRPLTGFADKLGRMS